RPPSFRVLPFGLTPYRKAITSSISGAGLTSYSASSSAIPSRNPAWFSFLRPGRPFSMPAWIGFSNNQQASLNIYAASPDYAHVQRLLYVAGPGIGLAALAGLGDWGLEAGAGLAALAGLGTGGWRPGLGALRSPGRGSGAGGRGSGGRGWDVRGRRSDVRGRRSDVRGRRSEVRGRR